MTAEIGVAFVFARYNRNSLAALTAALAVTPATRQVPVSFVRIGETVGDEVRSLMEGYGRLVVGFSFGTFDLIAAADAARLVRRATNDAKGGDVILVAGGPHASACPEEVLQLAFDFAVAGEGEVAFPSLVAALRDGLPPHDIAGLAFRSESGVHINPPGPPIDMDSFPPFSPERNIFSAVEITRGCPRGCAFCQVGGVFGRVFRHRSVPVLDEAARLMAASGRLDMRFVTPDSLSYGAPGEDGQRPELIEEMLRRLSSALGDGRIYLGTFPSEVWPKSVNPELMRLLRRYVANDNVVVGAQSGSPRVLKLMNRRHGVEDVRRAVEIIQGEGFTADVDFIFGFPGETDRDRRMTMKLILDLVGRGARVHAHLFVPLVGTRYAEMEPVKMPADIERELDRLAGAHMAYGSWRRQQERFEKVRDFRNKLRAARP